MPVGRPLLRCRALLERVAWRLGLDVTVRRSNRSHASREERELGWASSLRPRTVLDIGAHLGKQTRLYRKAFPGATIYAFEPTPTVFARLAACAEEVGGVRPFNVALADANGEVAFHENSATETSSLFATSKLGVTLYPHISSAQLRTVSARRLDDMVSDGDVKLDLPLFVKIDVQGAEMKVLGGGRRTIARASAVVIETSVCELYAGQPLFDDVYRCMRDMGFEYRGAMHQIIEPRSGRIVQEDSMFVPSGTPSFAGIGT